MLPGQSLEEVPDLTHPRILSLEFVHSIMDVWMFPGNLLLQVGLSSVSLSEPV